MLLLGLFVILAVIVAYLRPGRAPRWLSPDGATIMSLALFVIALSHVLASSFLISADALDPGTGIGVILAVVGGALAAAGSIMWTRVAPHTPLHPLKADPSWGRIIGIGISVLFLVVGMLGGWSFDGRTDVVIDPELEADIAALRERAAAEPENAGPIAAEISARLASARVEGAVATDGLSSNGARLGLWTFLAGLIAIATTFPGAGFFNQSEHRRWFWSAITAGIGAGIVGVSLAWILTHVRSADPNYVSGMGAFLTLNGGAFIIASTMGVLKEFRRSKLYDDDLTDREDVPAEVADALVQSG